MTYYLDSNVFIYPALYEGEKSTGTTALLERIVDGEVEAGREHAESTLGLRVEDRGQRSAHPCHG